MNLSTAQPDDAPAILALQKRAYASEARLYDDWSLPPLMQTLEELQSEIDTTLVLKATDGEILLGSVRATIENGVVQVGRLIVEPSAQRRGIGSTLLQAVEAAFPTAEKYELFTGSRSEGNIRLYERHGYSATTYREISPQVTLVFMSKPGAWAGG